MDGLIVAFFVPTSSFLTIVAPVWIFMHYRSKQTAQGACRTTNVSSSKPWLTAERMMDRIETLEAILDAETPGWRKRMQAE